MKKRLILSSIFILLLMLSFIVVIPLTKPKYSIIYAVLVVILVILILVYMFSGLAKLLVSLVYSIIIIGLLLLLPEYQHAIIAIGTALLVLNPLADVELFIENKLKNDLTSPLSISLRGKYWPFYGYRQEMKNYVRMPQTKKLINNKWYSNTRRIITLLMLSAGIYLFINELKNIYIDLLDYNIIQMTTFYGVVALFILTFILHKKGFTALYRAVILFLFPPMIGSIWIIDLNLVYQIIFTIIISLIFIADLVYEKYLSLRRVAYSPYKYYDSVNKKYVFANSFYEPYVYNETYHLIGIYKFKTDLENFNNKLEEILIYSNMKHFMLTCYTFDGTYIELYTEFYHKDAKKTKKFADLLEKIFLTKIKHKIIYDKDKEIYENTFFHNNEYIVARGLYLAKLLDELQINNKEVIISMIFTFKSISNINNFARYYAVSRMEELDDVNYYAVKVLVKSKNNKFLIEQAIRDILLNAMIYQGNYVRILLYYEGE